MFVGNCSGCFQIPTTPMFYWSPYPAAATLLKKPTFQISDILHIKNHPSPDVRAHLKRYDSKFEDFVRNGVDYKHNTPISQRHRDPSASTQSNEHPEVINYSRKPDSARCSLPSALEPLQALCSSTPRVYGLAGPGPESPQHSKSPTSTHRDLKFGINRILAEDFGNGKQNKENSPGSRGDGSTYPSSTRRPCECAAEGCPVYPRLAFPSAALHALQPPKYPHHTGADTLPGPYSVLNTEVSLMGAHSKRKRSWSRAVFSNLQRKGLEKRFEVQKYVTKPDRRQLAAMLGLTDAQVKVWFQNRRMKWRHAQQQNNDMETETSPEDKQEVEDGDDMNDTADDDEDAAEVKICDDNDSDKIEHSTSVKSTVCDTS